MTNISIELIDLPDELLMIIFNKLNNIEVLYSLIGINKYLDRILYDSMFTSCLTLTRLSPNNSISALADEILDRFCFEILPKIHHKIKCLTVEPLSMERIFLVDDYPNLYQLGLASIQWEGLVRIFNEENSIVDKFKNQISTLFISITNHLDASTHITLTRFVFRNILKIFPNLIHLRFLKFSNMDLRTLSFDYEIPIFSSSILLELHINVKSLSDCLYLLDGRLNQLRNFYVNIEIIYRLIPNIDMKKKLVNLKCFSLTSPFETYCYNESIVPLLHRMNNLEKLGLFLKVEQKNNFVDGNQLNNDIVNHMKRLNLFTFNIQSMIYFDDHDQINISSNEYIQHTFQTYKNTKVISYVDYFPHKNIGQCHYYSYPYSMDNYENITNNFPDGLFKCVQKISLFDERPFEHEFFMKISKAFPFVKELSIENFLPQNSISNNDNEDLSIIEYPYLTKLYLYDVHDHYIEQFLFHSKAFLSNNISLSVKYNSLRRVTHHFTRDQTKINSAKIKQLFLQGQELPRDAYHYFPHVESFY